MTTTSGISFLGLSTMQQSRLKTLHLSMSDLQRQITTQKKHDSYSGLGFDSLPLQKFRMDKGRIESYLDNIKSVTTRINLMSDSMTRAADMGRQLMGSLQSQTEDDVDIETIKTIARNGMEFLRDLVNITLEGRHLFAGSDTEAQPFSSQNTLDTNFQTEVTNWLNGTITTAQIGTNANAFTSAQLGFNPALSSSGSISIRIEDTTEVDYTVMGDANGFDDIMRAMGFAANMEFPDPATDVPTNADYHAVINQILSIVKRGVDAMDRSVVTLGSKFNIINDLQTTHERDVALFENFIADIENADTTEAVTQLQALQVQMTASYEVSRIVSQLTLVNYI